MTRRIEDRTMTQLSADSYDILPSFHYNYYRGHAQTSFHSIEKLTDYNLINYKTDKPSTIRIHNVKAPILKVPSTEQRKNLDTLNGFDPGVDYVKISTAKLEQFLEAIKLRRLDPFENDFVSLRGVLRTIMLTPFRRRIKWRIGASKFRNTIFMRSYEEYNFTPMAFDKENQEAYRYMNIKRLTTEPEKEVLGKDVIDKEYFSVLQTQLSRRNHGMFKLLYSGELDAIIDPKRGDENPRNFTNIRMTFAYKSEREQKNFLLRKYPPYWAISALSGIDKITVANRDNCWNIEHFSGIHVPSMPRDCEEYYNGHKMLDVASYNYLYGFLEHVKELMANEDNPESLYLFDYNFPINSDPELPSFSWGVKSQFTSSSIQPENSFVQCKKIAEDFREWRILPDWFIDEMEPLSAAWAAVLDDYLDRD